jgi:hypothetical protein
MKYNYYPSSAMNTWLKGIQHLLTLLVLFSVCQATFLFMFTCLMLLVQSALWCSMSQLQ